MKKIIIFFLLLFIYSATFSQNIEIKSVETTGFEVEIQTTLTVNTFVDDFTSNNDCKLWITVEEFASWESGYPDNPYDNFEQVTVTPDDNNSIISTQINISPTGSVSQTIQNFNINFTLSDEYSATGKKEYEMKVVIDQPFYIDGFDEEAQEILAEKFLPVLLLDDGSQIEDDFPLTGVGPEVFIPKSVDILLSNSQIWNREGVNEFLINATKDNLLTYCESTNYLNINDEIYDGDEDDIINWFYNNKDNYNNQLFVSFFEESGNVILTYWFFYLYNNNKGWGDLGLTTNYHIGDWEGMNIVFNATDIIYDWQTARPIGAATSSHTSSDFGKRRNWNNVLKINNHPVIFVSNGSHASYFHSGKSENQAGFVRDYHYGNGKWILPEDINTQQVNQFIQNYDITYSDLEYYGQIDDEQLEILPRLNNISQNSNFWNFFGGVWGESYGIIRDRIESMSPSGPPYIESVHNGNNTDGYKWFKPLTWYLQQEYQNADSLVADFFTDTISGDEPLEVHFYDNSSDNVTGWEWDFDNDGIIDSYLENPVYIYDSVGIYSIELVITDGSNNVSITKSNFINVGDTGLFEGLVAYYPFNGNADDESGNCNHGSVYGATLTNDRFGNENSAFFFDGQDDFIEISDNLSLDITSQITISSWIYKYSNNPWSSIVTKGSDYEDNNYSLHNSVSEGLVFTSDLGLHGESSVTVPLYEWYFVAMTWDGYEVRFYFNSNLDSLAVAPLTIQLNDNDSSLIIGLDLPWDDEYFFGVIDDIRIYNRALSEDEILSIYTLGSLESPINLTISEMNDYIILNWDVVSGATSYKIYSSENPYSGFELDESGEFNGTSWTAPLSESKIFYYVTATN